MPVLVRAPATSANLGPGFDALGLALGLHDEVQARVTPSGLDIDVTGEGAADVTGAGEAHLVVRAMRAAFDDLGCGQPPGIALRCVNRIPHGRGLGSSAAAIVAGILAARTLAGAGHDPGDALALANQIEGHPDNVAPCLYGGLTIAWLAGKVVRAVRMEPLPQISTVAIVAPAPVSTEVARGLLPKDVPHGDAARNAGRAALLVAALTARPEALLDATEDWLHQPYRAPAMPATRDLVSRLRETGLPAVVSGSGPSVLAFPASGRELDRLDSTVKETGIEWRISPLEIQRRGVSVSSGRCLDPLPRLGWLRRNAVGVAGVRLRAASSTSFWGRCWSSTCGPGGNVYVPTEWAFGFTSGVTSRSPECHPVSHLHAAAPRRTTNPRCRAWMRA
jgi:homoserine kinase